MIIVLIKENVQANVKNGPLINPRIVTKITLGIIASILLISMLIILIEKATIAPMRADTIM